MKKKNVNVSIFDQKEMKKIREMTMFYVQIDEILLESHFPKIARRMNFVK